MDHLAQDAVAAAFTDREVAHTCYEALEREGFPHRWMAVTKPAQDEAWGDGSAETTSENDVVEASDGALGPIGRFFSGEGNSLRRSLEDHGIATEEAIAIDESLGLGGAVIVVAAEDRVELAASILRQSGGQLYGVAHRPSGDYGVDADFGAADELPLQTLELHEERLTGYDARR